MFFVYAKGIDGRVSTVDGNCYRTREEAEEAMKAYELIFFGILRELFVDDEGPAWEQDYYDWFLAGGH